DSVRSCGADGKTRRDERNRETDARRFRYDGALSLLVHGRPFRAQPSFTRGLFHGPAHGRRIGTHALAATARASDAGRCKADGEGVSGRTGALAAEVANAVFGNHGVERMIVTFARQRFHFLSCIGNTD